VAQNSPYQDWCMTCCCRYHPLMLTGYCLSSLFDGMVFHCDHCGAPADLAMVKAPVGPGGVPRILTR